MRSIYRACLALSTEVSSEPGAPSGGPPPSLCLGQGRGYDCSGPRRLLPVKEPRVCVSPIPTPRAPHGSCPGLCRLAAKVVTPGGCGLVGWARFKEVEGGNKEESKVSEVCVGTSSQLLIYSIHKRSWVPRPGRSQEGRRISLALTGGEIRLEPSCGTSHPWEVPQVRVHFCVSKTDLIRFSSCFWIPCSHE